MESSPHTLVARRNGHDFVVEPTYASFWREFSAESWEPETFAVFDQFIDRRTLHLDVGAWIGPTVLYAATRAAKVIGFEPDPVAYGILQTNVAANPQLAPIQVEHVAIAPRAGRIQIGSRGAAGDSMSSELFAKCETTWEVEGRTLDAYLDNWPESDPVFVKIDIEGGEYRLLPTLAKLLRRPNVTLFLSLHPAFFLTAYLGRGRLVQAAGEFKLLRAWLPVARALRHFRYCRRTPGGEITARELLHRKTWRHTQTLLCSHRPSP